MKTKYRVLHYNALHPYCYCLEFSTLSSLYSHFHGFLKDNQFEFTPQVYVFREWEISGVFYPAGSVDFFFVSPHD